MYERFTDRARQVMQLANQEAQRFNHEYIGTEHVLLGLIKEGSGVAARVLKNLGLDLRQLRVEVEKLIQSGPEPVGRKLPQTPRAKKVIEYAMEEARHLDHNYVGSEHLLLGLLREDEGVAAQVLTNLGLKLDDVRNETWQLLGRPQTSSSVAPPYRAGAVIAPSPRSSLRFWLLFAIAAALGLVLVSLPRPQFGGTGRSHLAVGKPLPPVHLVPLTFDGDPVTSTELGGRVVVINLWGTWCPPCRAELPHIAKLGERHADDDRFKLLAVSCGGGPAEDDELKNLFEPTAALLNQQRLSLSAYADPGGETRERLAKDELFQHAYPTTLVIDRQGVVRGVWAGYAPGDERDVAALVAELLGK